MTAFIHSFRSEMLKKRHTAAAYLVVLSALFMPGIVLFARLTSFDGTWKENNSHHLWEIMYMRHWAAMGMFFLPLAIILFASLITNIEFKNNTWKQLHATPQALSTIFFAKFTVMLLMLLQLFIIFNIGIYVAGVLPSLFFRALSYPVDPFPFMRFLRGNLYFFIDCLPVIALQYLLSLQFKNFLVPVGVGFGLLIASLIAMNWKYGYIVPYAYSPLNFRENQGKVDPSVNIHVCAIIYFCAFMLLSYILYLRKKEKG